MQYIAQGTIADAPSSYTVHSPRLMSASKKSPYAGQSLHSIHINEKPADSDPKSTDFWMQGDQSLPLQSQVHSENYGMFTANRSSATRSSPFRFSSKDIQGVESPQNSSGFLSTSMLDLASPIPRNPIDSFTPENLSKFSNHK